jgi:diacylglycerol kinase family enzyme
MPHWRLILNGKSAGDQTLRAAVRAHAHGGRPQRARDLGSRRRRALRGRGDRRRRRYVVAAGGDGTLSGVAGTLAHAPTMRSRLPSLALVPMGTANDFAVAAGIPEDPGEALALAQRPPRSRSTCCTSTGRRRNPLVRQPRQWRIRHPGHRRDRRGPEEDARRLGLPDHRASPSSAGSTRSTRASSAPDSSGQGDFIALGIGNGRQAGGGQVLCPDALIDDGLLELTIVPQLSPARSAATRRAARWIGSVRKAVGRPALPLSAGWRARARLPHLLRGL